MLKLSWLFYEEGSRGAKAIKPYLEKFIGFYTTDGYVCYKVFNHDETIEVVTLDGVDYSFSKPDQAKKFKSICQEYINVEHSEIFLEEPEDNLFPPTQCQFVNCMLEQIKTHGDMLFITTHSPYVLNQLIKAAPKELSVMFTHPQKPASIDFSVKQLNDEEIHEAYDNGVDMFFNFEMYV